VATDGERCDRWAECRLHTEEALREMLEGIREEKRADHSELWAAIAKTNEAITKTNDSISRVAVVVGNLTGKFVGYLAVGSIVVGVLVFLASKVLTHGGTP
jgi:hypothetical protein